MTVEDNPPAVELAIPIEKAGVDPAQVGDDSTAITLMRLQPLNVFETLIFKALPRNAQ